MLRSIILQVFFATVSTNLFATHYRGGEITYKITGPYTVEASVTTYTKISYPSNLADRDSVIIQWGDGTSSVLPRVNGTNDGSCTGASPCGVIVLTDVKKNIYEGVHVYLGPPLPGANGQPGLYLISFTDVNLLGGIANIDAGNSISSSLYMQDTIALQLYHELFNTIGSGSSSVFLTPGVAYAFEGDIFTFNSTAYDPDADSLSYELVEPGIVPDYILPDQYCNQSIAPGNTFSLNPQTGDITWITPCAEGFFEFGLEVREYYCGFLMGTVTRNMQIIVLPDPVRNPVLSSVHDTVIEPGELLQFAVTSTDSSAYIDSLQVLGGAFQDTLSANRPVFTQISGNPATGAFSWQPDSSFVRPYSYLFTVIATNNYTSAGPDGIDPYPASTVKSFRVWVGDTTSLCILTSVNNISASDLQVHIFPNPANDVLHIESAQQLSTIVVSDISGRQVLSAVAGKTNYNLSVSGLEDGVYLLSITAIGTTITRRFVKAE